MDTLAHFCLLFIFVSVFPLHMHTARGDGEQICHSISCGEIDIQFPFGLKGANQSRRCSYPGFQLSCDKHSRAILSLPSSGDLIVKSINYEAQTIQVNDLNGCLPKLFLHKLNFSGSPFTFDATLYEFYNLTFLRCPSNITDSYPLPPISCLSSHEGNRNSNFSSAVLFSWFLGSPASSSLFETCEVMSSAIVPISNMAMWPFWPDLTSDIELMWIKPRCGDCAARGRVCGFTKDASLQVGCFPDPNQSPGLPRSAKYGLALGVGIPGLLCIMGLSCFICCKFRVFTNRHRPITELPTSVIALQPAPFLMGLDGPSIEKYPKTLIGDSGRLPRPNDNTCPICLSEYEPKETLRTIPECNHYFHAHCIDAWLKMNATCPLCRNSPDASSTVTPSSSSSSLFPSSSLSSSP